MSEPVAAIYCRISRDVEGERVGVERQEADCRELARRLDLRVVRVFTDNDTGASDKTRKTKVRHEYQAMLEAVEQGVVRHIVSYSNSRLTRRMLELEGLIQLHQKTGVRIHTVVSGDDDLSTADGLMVARIKASVDAAEADRISERSKAALLHKAMTGEPRVTSHRPFGWMPDGKTLDPFEAEVIRKGVRDLIDGVPLNKIRERWMREGIKTPAGGTEWHWTNVKEILTSWRTVGVRTYLREVLLDADGNAVRGKWEPIVTMEEREQALRQLKSRSITRKRSGKYLLTGLLRCECGKPMWGNVANSSGRSTQYACRDLSRHVSIDASRLEKHVFLELYAELLNRQMEGDASTDVPEPVKWAGEGRLSVVIDKIDELMTEYNENRLSGQIVFPQVTKLEQERDDLRRERDAFYASHTQPARLTPDNVAEATRKMLSMPFGEAVTMLRQEAEVIVIRKGVRGVQARDPEVFKKRVDIIWKKH